MWQKIGSINPKVIYALMIAVIVIALLKPMGLAVIPSDDIKKVYDLVDKMPPKSIIFIGFDYSASAIPEIEPGVIAMMTQGLRKNLRFVVMGIYSTMGGDIANEVWKGLQRDFPDKRYGIDFVNLGTKPGAQVLLQKLVTSVAEASAGADFFGSKLETLPLMSEFKTIKDAKAIATFTNGTPDRDYVKHIADPLKMPFIFCSGIGGIPAVMPLYQSGQISGIISGMKGAAEYELLIGKPGSAVSGMDVQSLSHLLLVVLLIIGNISYVITHKQRLWR